MLNYNNLDICGQLEANAVEALTCLIMKVKCQNMRVVEVGSWKGYSTAILADCIKDCGGTVWAVDHWRGNVGTGLELLAKQQNIYSVFEKNIKALELWDIIIPLNSDSLSAGNKFDDDSLDLVFLDADHRYQQFIADLVAWYPKVRRGGIICGHDCEQYYEKLSEEQKNVLKSHLDKDIIDGMHPGIVVGLREQFGDDYTIMPGSTIWFVNKESDGKYA